MKLILLAFIRRLLTRIRVLKVKGNFVWQNGLHIGANVRIWSPDEVRVGRDVYIGKDVHIECNAIIGNYVMIANRVAFIGKNDHEYREIGVPIRFGKWIGSEKNISPFRQEKVWVEDDVWIGFGANVLTGVKIGRGSIVAAGSVVVKDVAPYTIVGGNPARVLGNRFSDVKDIERHEYSIQRGTFEFSEKGADWWVVEPYLGEGK